MLANSYRNIVYVLVLVFMSNENIFNLFYLFDLFPSRTVGQCSSVPISWTRRTFLASPTLSWSFTAATRTERECLGFNLA